MGTPMLIHQPNYSMFNRQIENGLADLLLREGVGLIAFGTLAGGILAGRYLEGIPADSRAGFDPRYLSARDITEEKLKKVRALNELALERGQTLSQMALTWVLREPAVTTVLVGASKPEQITENLAALSAPALSEEELSRIDGILEG